MPRHLDTGQWGERHAERALKAEGYKIVGRRVRPSPRDELDLVAKKDGILVFVEVKTRKGTRYGAPMDAVDSRKQHVLSRAAVRYLKKLRAPGINFRFDVVEVIGAMGDRSPEIRHIENAFPLDRRYVLPC